MNSATKEEDVCTNDSQVNWTSTVQGIAATGRLSYNIFPHRLPPTSYAYLPITLPNPIPNDKIFFSMTHEAIVHEKVIGCLAGFNSSGVVVE